MIDESLRERVLSDGTIAGIIVDRFTPMKMSDNPVFPAVVYQRISSIREQNISDGRVYYCNAIYQLDIYSPSFDTTKDLAAKIFARLEGFRGTVLGVDIQGILSQNEIDLYEEDVRLFRRSQQYRVIFIET